jgi:secreted trypsin-like serine protease
MLFNHRLMSLTTRKTTFCVGLTILFLVSLLSDTIFVESRKRIIGGTNAPRGLYPWYAFGNYYLCGASFIWNDILLTAAHCRNETFRNVYAGGIYANLSDQTRYPFHSMIRHPLYNASKSATEHDIAVVKITGNYNGSIAYFNSKPELPAENTTLMAMGYGENNLAGPDPNRLVLQHVDLLAWSNTSCSAYWASTYKSQMHVCSGSPVAKDTCIGDSGSPLLLGNRSVIAGLVSFGAYPCAQPNVPAVNTRVSLYAPWIRTQICFLTSYTRPSWCPNPLCIAMNSTVYQCTANNQCCGGMCNMTSGGCV